MFFVTTYNSSDVRISPIRTSISCRKTCPDFLVPDFSVPAFSVRSEKSAGPKSPIKTGTEKSYLCCGTKKSLRNRDRKVPVKTARGKTTTTTTTTNKQTNKQTKQNKIKQNKQTNKKTYWDFQD